MARSVSGADHGGAGRLDIAPQGAVGRHHRDVRVFGDEFADQVIGGVASAPRRVADRDRTVLALRQVGLCHVEDERRGFAEALQIA